MTTAALLVVTVFLACAVEAIEALTIVLAVGTTRGWRSTLYGVAGGLAVLTVVVAVLGPTLTVIPLGAVRLVVGGLLLVFGLQWLRKAILRASGFTAMHDEAAIYDSQIHAAQTATGSGRWLLVTDRYAFTLAFKGVLLEGLEVAFIVLTVGTNLGSIALAVLGAALAVLVVTVIGIAVRAPLARVPENTMKFAVGVMLTSFGIFWGAEGAGVRWPGEDVALLGVLAYVLGVAGIAVGVLRRIQRKHGATEPAGGG
ncbi:MAG: COG4280 domain-containing protein [Pseudonocardiaceae bacterium]